MSGHHFPIDADVFRTVMLAALVLGLTMTVAMGTIFAKAGRPAWACLVPFYNLYILCDVASVPAWVLIGMFFPLLNLVSWVLICLGLAQNFGRSTSFAVGLMLMSPVFLPVLAFGSATWRDGSPGLDAGPAWGGRSSGIAPTPGWPQRESASSAWPRHHGSSDPAPSPWGSNAPQATPGWGTPPWGNVPPQTRGWETPVQGNVASPAPPTFCRQCGAGLPLQGEACSSCGTPVA